MLITTATTTIYGRHLSCTRILARPLALSLSFAACAKIFGSLSRHDERVTPLLKSCLEGRSGLRSYAAEYRAF